VRRSERVNELVGRARLDDGDAFAVPVERHHAAVHRAVRTRLGDEHGGPSRAGRCRQR
jgi:hypothetical protein